MAAGTDSGRSSRPLLTPPGALAGRVTLPAAAGPVKTQPPGPPGPLAPPALPQAHAAAHRASAAHSARTGTAVGRPYRWGSDREVAAARQGTALLRARPCCSLRRVGRLGGWSGGVAVAELSCLAGTVSAWEVEVWPSIRLAAAPTRPSRPGTCSPGRSSPSVRLPQLRQLPPRLLLHYGVR